MIEYLIHAPDRDTFVAVLTAMTNPVTREPLASVDEDGRLIPSRWLRIDEIGPVVKTPGEYDEDGNEITAPVVVRGHHVNLVAYGPLFAKGDPMAKFRPLLGSTEWEPSRRGEFDGYRGTSGVKVAPGDGVSRRARVWA